MHVKCTIYMLYYTRFNLKLIFIKIDSFGVRTVSDTLYLPRKCRYILNLYKQILNIPKWAKWLFRTC